MPILNKRVKHDKYGEGTIIRHDNVNNTFRVRYDSEKEAVYDYPDDLNGGDILKLLDADKDTTVEIENALKIKNGILLVNNINGKIINGLHDAKKEMPKSLIPKRINQLKHGDCFDYTAIVIYDALCSNTNFNWNSSYRGKFGMQQHLYAENATPEGYNVWFIPYSSYTERIAQNRGIYNNIVEGSNDIVEYWIDNVEFDFKGKPGEKTVTFIKNKFDQYEFWGVMETTDIDKVEGKVVQKYSSEIYQTSK